MMCLTSGANLSFAVLVGGVSEDGVMTAELLETLYASERIEEHDSLTISTQSSSDSMSLKKDGANGAVSSSIHKIAGVQQTRLNVDPNTEVDKTKHRVFLFGENRWVEPSRLISNNKQPGGTLARCMTCRECDGTRDANLEPRSLEWVGDGAECPHCERPWVYHPQHVRNSCLEPPGFSLAAFKIQSRCNILGLQRLLHFGEAL